MLPHRSASSEHATLGNQFDITSGILGLLNSAVGDLSRYIDNNSIENASLLKTVQTLAASITETELLSTDAFHLFPKLPPELRLRIWKQATMIPQVIGMTEWNTEKWRQGGEIRNEQFLAGTHARCPILRTCREAREAAVKTKESYYSRFGVFAARQPEGLYKLQCRHSLAYAVPSGCKKAELAR
jgi:hypothetical protein